jgi:hypothetical protein
MPKSMGSKSWAEMSVTSTKTSTTRAVETVVMKWVLSGCVRGASGPDEPSPE